MSKSPTFVLPVVITEKELNDNGQEFLSTIKDIVEQRRMSVLLKESLPDVLKSTYLAQHLTECESLLASATEELKENKSVQKENQDTIVDLNSKIAALELEPEHLQVDLPDRKNDLKHANKVKKDLQTIERELMRRSAEAQEIHSKASVNVKKEAYDICELHDSLVAAIKTAVGTTRLGTIGAGYKGLGLQGDKRLDLKDVLDHISISLKNQPQLKWSATRELDKKIAPDALKYIYSNRGFDTWAEQFALVCEISRAYKNGKREFTNKRIVEELVEALCMAASGNSNPLKALIEAVPLQGENPEHLSTWFRETLRIVTDYNKSHNSDTPTPPKNTLTAAAASGGAGGGGTVAKTTSSPTGTKDIQYRVQSLMIGLRYHLRQLRNLPASNNSLPCPLHTREAHDAFDCPLCIEIGKFVDVKWTPK